MVYLFVKDKFIISLNKTVSDNISKVYDTSIQTSIQNIIKESKEDNDLLSSVGQMSLCFTEVIVFSILAILSKFIGEKIFIVISYMPKATVQASIGGIALAENLPCGTIVLIAAVISILITAPLGSFLIDNLYKRLLIKDLE